MFAEESASAQPNFSCKIQDLSTIRVASQNQDQRGSSLWHMISDSEANLEDVQNKINRDKA